MGKLLQVQTTVAASFGILITGALYVWPSYTLDIYKAQNGTVLSAPMTEFEASMLSSIPSLGAMLGTALVGSIIDRIGRKKGGLVMTLPFILSWAIIEVSTSSLPILCARFLAGAAAGASMAFGPIYISEVAEDSIRGTLASAPIAFYCIGTLCSYLMGWFLSYHVTIWLNITMSVFCAALLMTVVESPVYLIKQNREEEARQALAQYRGLRPDSKQLLEEISQLRQQLLPAVEMTPIPDSEEKGEIYEKEKLKKDEEDDADVVVPKKSPIKMLFSSPASCRGFIIITLCLGLQVCMGQVPVQVYAKDLFTAAVPDMSSHMCSVLLALIMVTGSCSPSFLADRTGRRFLIITSCIMVAVCMVTLGALLQSQAGPAWLSVVILLSYCFFFNFGAGSIPYVLIAEMFVPEVQSIASMLLIEFVWFLCFLLIGIFPYCVKYFGFHGMCYFFAFVSIVNCTCSYLLIPETKGLSNQQIQEALLRRRK